MARRSQLLDNIQTVFSRGEISPRLYGRVDNDAYYKGFKDSLNMLTYPQGAAVKRSGTRFVKEVKNSANKTILVPFRFSVEQNYILEFGNQYMRVYRNRGQVESSPSTPYEISTPWLSADLENLKFTQSYDTLFVCCAGYAPQVITRTSDTAWSLNAFDFKDMPYLPENTSATTITPSSATGTITITASANLFSAGDVGRYIKSKHSSSDWGWAEITGYTSPTEVTAVVKSTFTSSSATAKWRLSYFGGSMGFPTVVTIYEERMVFANTALYPATMFFSETGDFYSYSDLNLSGNVVDSNGMVLTIGDDQANSIAWMSGGRLLMVGTTGAEYSVTGGTAATYAPITPDSVTVKREARAGSALNVRAHRVNASVLYASYTGNKVKEIAYNFNIDAFLSRDTTLFNEHLTYNGIVDMEYVQEREPTLFIVRPDGWLIAFLYNKEQEIEGYTKHWLGGHVERVASIPSPNRDKDDLWLIVRRTVNGVTKRYIEYLEEDFGNVGKSQSDAFFVDSGLTYDGRLSATLTPSATTGSGVTFTASASVFDSGMVGSRIVSGSAMAEITGYTSGTVVTGTVVRDFSSTSAIASGSWSVAVDSVSGAGHLEGEEVALLGDGGVIGNKTVSSGSVDLGDFYSIVHLGVPYDAYIELLPIEAQQFGTLQGRVKTVPYLHIYVTNTLGLKCSVVPNVTEEIIPYNDTSDLYGVAPPMVTGLSKIHVPSGYDKELNLKLISETPTPFVLNYVVQNARINN